jgi:anti-anti-sigma regulatory factor
MPSVHVDNLGEMAIIECAGKFVRTAAASKLQDAVTSQIQARVVVLDLTEMHAIGGGGLGVLVLLQRWAREHEIRLKLFNPSNLVREKLKHVDFEIATLEQVMSLLGRVDKGVRVRLARIAVPVPSPVAIRLDRGSARAILICCGRAIRSSGRGISDSRPSQSARRTGHPLW